MANDLEIRFFKDKRGREPVKDWLLKLPSGVKKTISTDISLLKYCIPHNINIGIFSIQEDLFGFPDTTVDLYILFTMDKNYLILLDGFILKNEKHLKRYFRKAIKRLKQYREAENEK